MTYQEAAKRFGVGESTVRSWARAGLIKRHRKPLDKKTYVRASEIERLKNAEPKVQE
jgi:predicted site-specific integrase-resolvase